MKLFTILNALPVIGPVLSAAPAVKKLIDETIAALHPADQAAAKSASACSTSAPALIATAAMRQSISLRTVSPRTRQAR